MPEAHWRYTHSCMSARDMLRSKPRLTSAPAVPARLYGRGSLCRQMLPG